MTLLGNLPEIKFAELGPAEVEKAIITGFEALVGRTLYPGDPERVFLESLAYILALQNALIDAAGKQNFLAYAAGPHLDHLGSLMDTPRLAAQAAKTTVAFRLAEPLTWSVLIPEGSRIAVAGGDLVFATDRTATITPGEVEAQITVTATTLGANANGLVPGQINRMVDVIGYIKEVANTTTTAQGSDIETDEPYRRRIQLAPEHFSVAGPEGAYRYHTLTTHPDIADCAVWRPIPGTVDVRPILKGGHLPTEEILIAVRETLEHVRPLTDTVIVAAPEVVEYEVRGGWYLPVASEPLAESTKESVATALATFLEWQKSLPGRDINPTKLVADIERAGAKRVVLESPGFGKLEPHQIARETIVNFEFLGVENE